MTETEKILAENEHYKKLFGVGDIATRAYQAVVKVLEQQVLYLDKFKLDESIVKVAKDDPVYARAMEIWNGLPDMVLKMKKLKDELGIEYVEKGEVILPVSPQSIARLSQ